MVISHICTQGLSLHWKTLNQSAGSFSCIDSLLCHLFVCLFFVSLVRSFVRPSVLPFIGLLNSFVPSFVSSFICSFVRLTDRSFVRFLFFVRCFARLSSPIVHLEMASSLLGIHAYSSFISIDDFFHDIPSPRFVLYVFSTNHEVTHDGHSAAKTN